MASLRILKTLLFLTPSHHLPMVAAASLLTTLHMCVCVWVCWGGGVVERSTEYSISAFGITVNFTYAMPRTFSPSIVRVLGYYHL